MSAVRAFRQWRAAVAVAAASIAACGTTPTPIDLQLLASPTEVRERGVLPSCGVERVGQGGGYNLEARRCFWDAYTGGEPAEFITTRPTAAGKPLLMIVRSLGGGRAELLVDESAIWGRPTWTRSICPVLTQTTDPSVAIDWIPGAPDVPCEQEFLRG